MDIQTRAMLLDLMATALSSAGLLGGGRWPVSDLARKRSLQRALKKRMTEAQKIYINSHEAYRVLDADWFRSYLCEGSVIFDLCNYMLREEYWKWARGVYVRDLAVEAGAYAARYAGGISDQEEMALRNFFRMLMKTVQDVRADRKRGFLLALTWETELPVWEVDRLPVYRDALTDQKQYLALVEELLLLGNREDWTKKGFWEYPRTVLEERPELKAVARDFYLNRDVERVREWRDCLAGRRWEHNASCSVFHWLKRNPGEAVPAEMEAWVREYYDRRIGTVDIRGSVYWKTDSNMVHRSYQADELILYAERFSLEMPEEKARELLFRCAYEGKAQGGAQPDVPSDWLPARYLTEAKIREQVITNLLTEDLKGDVMRWHIRYCRDHKIRECETVIRKLVKSPIRNLCVRMDALVYVCDGMSASEACQEVLSGLRGEMFFFGVEQFLDSRDGELADLVWAFGEQYPRQKYRCDIYLTLLQDRRGVESLRRHLQRRNGIPLDEVVPGPAEAVGQICSLELVEELERFLQTAWKDGFRDSGQVGGGQVDGGSADDGLDSSGSLWEAAATALIGLACRGAREREQVMAVFDRLLERHHGDKKKTAKIHAWIDACNL